MKTLEELKAHKEYLKHQKQAVDEALTKVDLDIQEHAQRKQMHDLIDELMLTSWDITDRGCGEVVLYLTGVRKEKKKV